MKAYLLAVITVSLCVGLSFGYYLGLHKEQEEVSQSFEGDTLVLGVANSSELTYRNPTYRLSLALPNSIAYAGRASSSGIDFGMVFQSPNGNTSVTNNRNTPNGFNTAAYDQMMVGVFRNPSGSVLNNSSSIRAWLVRDRQVQPRILESITVGSSTWIHSEEADGIDSFGLYYYLVTESYIYQIGTDDFPKEAMESLLQGFDVAYANAND